MTLLAKTNKFIANKSHAYFQTTGREHFCTDVCTSMPREILDMILNYLLAMTDIFKNHSAQFYEWVGYHSHANARFIGQNHTHRKFIHWYFDDVGRKVFQGLTPGNLFLQEIARMLHRNTTMIWASGVGSLRAGLTEDIFHIGVPPHYLIRRLALSFHKAPHGLMVEPRAIEGLKWITKIIDHRGVTIEISTTHLGAQALFKVLTEIAQYVYILKNNGNTVQIHHLQNRTWYAGPGYIRYDLSVLFDRPERLDVIQNARSLVR